ncbi:RdgB/HAM1 family non-canonical purine NTP pyrophosphatase [Thermomicrobium sp. 4228-Ro]|uniref:RdgB/HAM1 family non-canonical purine NTP pyrophosphatase n=1 Tax=Thermomicrobium sp. 4228-Ro TaxID=2993937 RepID=UPI002248BF56|nr:RdgB/HAM1 family non-canonical purine NTP pyrophosphatase [Thermomicrobium sp. 4228-Ro]MCX2726164.1 RdgB/HAM1 family non-canonical purine NTP pyrophosphatase [Thermomicrobium sp. 4228-Ro]
MTKPRIVLATANPGKLREFRSLLPSCIDVVSAAELGIDLPPETGHTFAENALLKARAVARASGLIAIADDSGLEVDALGGRPGVHSARFAGEGATDAQNVAFLLEQLRGLPPTRRTARFRAVIALVAPDGHEALAEGTVEGTIVEAPRGQRGFGYDPIFRPLSEEHTFAEMTLEEKNRISHRARALERATAILREWLGCVDVQEPRIGDDDRRSKRPDHG